MGIRHWGKPRGRPAAKRLGWVAVLGMGILAGACSDDGILQPGAGPGAPDGPGDPSEDATSVGPFVRRVELDFQAVGSFRPGAPITVTAVARGRRPAGDVDFDVVVLDEEAAPGSTPPVRKVQAFRGGMGRGQEQRLSATLTFPRAGLYRVVASARSQPPGDEKLAPADSVVGNFSSETLYLLIDENGGRPSREYSAPAGRTPLYGSFGPFTQGAAPGARAAAAPGGPSAQTTGTVTGVMWNYNDLTASHERLGPTVGTLNCRNSTGTFVASTINVAADGTFSFSCASGVYNGQIHLRSANADVYGHGGAFAGAGFDQTMGSSLSLQSSNQYAGYVFLTLNQHIPVAVSRFGRQRSQITAWVSTTDPTIVYCPAVTTTSSVCTRADIIRSHQGRVFGEDGIFVTVHEYGHAFHYKAIEPWPNTYGCDPGGHNPAVPWSRACAFVEGFADFFAGWILANRLTSAYGYSDYNWETRSYAGPDGLITEGAAAGFFYDLADGSGDLDASGNTTAYEESFDTAVYPGSFIANIIASCSPYTQTSTGGYTYANPLDGMDQVVYCVEGHVNAEIIGPTYGSSWRTQWDGVSWSPAFSYPAGFSGTTVRTLWKWNFYRTTT
ncbi:MAG TPA: hypothetical protein VFR81_30715 [Longimicrobium sp.]|nr:hypothetical protein [Longimicrobium sp.]